MTDDRWNGLLELARERGRKWADDQAAIGQLTFGPREDVADAMLDGFIRELRTAMAAAMTKAAIARRDELLVAANTAAAADRDAAAEAATREAKADAEWQERQAEAAKSKREKSTTNTETTNG